MCLGNSETVKTEKSVATPNAAVSGAATQNLDFAKGLQTSGFTPYSGNQVADFGGLQSRSFDLGSALGTNGGAYTPEAEGLLSRYGSAPASSVSADTISSRMSPYMSQYVQQSLAPQIEAQDQQFNQQRKNLNAVATSSGAFGDSRAGIEGANLTNQQNIARSGLIGNAYNAAFNTAIGAGAQDVSNNLNAQTTNAGLNEQSLSRALGAAGGLENLGNYRGGIANTVNSLGQQQTGQDQAKLTAAYNQWLMGQQYPFQTTQLMNQSIAAGATGMPADVTKTTSAPDNSGWGMLGTALGVAAAPFTGGASLGALPFLSKLGSSSGGSGSAMGWAPSPNGGTIAPMYAKGGRPPVGKPAIVGEKGMEAFQADDGTPPVAIGQGGPQVVVPKKPGVVVPHNKLREAAKKRDDKKKPPALPKPNDGLARALAIAA